MIGDVNAINGTNKHNSKVTNSSLIDKKWSILTCLSQPGHPVKNPEPSVFSNLQC